AVDASLAVSRVKPKEPEDAQIVFADTLERRSDETHAAHSQIGKAADVIVDPPIDADRQSIHGEIATQGIRLEAAAETHRSMAAVRFDVLAQRGDFERRRFDDDSNAAVLDAGRQAAPTRLLGPGGHDLW